MNHNQDFVIISHRGFKVLVVGLDSQLKMYREREAALKLRQDRGAAPKHRRNKLKTQLPQNHMREERTWTTLGLEDHSWNGSEKIRPLPRSASAEA